MGDGIVQLLNFLHKTKINSRDNDVTLGEAQAFIQGAFDTNGDGQVNNEDRFDTNGNSVIDAGDDPKKIQQLREMAYSDLSTVSDPVLRESLKQAQAALRLALSQVSPVNPPPHIDSTNPLFGDELIRNPYDLADDNEDKRWSDMRKDFQGQTVEINRDDAKGLVTNIINNLKSSNPTASVEDQAKAVVHGLWNNEDSVGGEKRQVFRVEEIKGVLDYINALPESEREQFKQAFFKEMANYISNPDNGLDQQFVMDSLLEAIQSTDFSGDPESEALGNFMKELTVGVAENSEFFKSKTPTAQGSSDVVIGNYDSTNDGGIYGALTLVRYNDGTFGFIEHQVSSPTNKTRYVFTGSSPAPQTVTPPGGFGGGTTPTPPSGSGAPPTGTPPTGAPPPGNAIPPTGAPPAGVPPSATQTPNVSIIAEPIRLTEEMLNHLRAKGGILQYFGYNPSEPATEIKAWENYAFAIAAKTGDLLQGIIPGVRNSTSIEDGKHNVSLDPDYFKKLEERILELARQTGKSPEQILRETGITNPKEAWAVISSDVFQVRIPTTPPPASTPPTIPPPNNQPPSVTPPVSNEVPPLGNLDPQLKLQNTMTKITQSVNEFIQILKGSALTEDQKKPFREIAKKLAEYLSSPSPKPDSKLLKEIAKLIKEAVKITQGIPQEEKDRLLNIAKSLEEAASEIESNPLLNEPVANTPPVTIPP